MWEPEKFSIIRKKTRPSKHFYTLKISFSAITERDQSNKKEIYEEIIEAQIVIENLIPLYSAEIDEFANRPVFHQHKKLIKNLRRDIQHDFTESQIEEFLDQKKNEKKSNLFADNGPGSKDFKSNLQLVCLIKISNLCLSYLS